MENLNQEELGKIIKLRAESTEMLRQVQTMFNITFEGLMDNDIRILDRALKVDDLVNETYSRLTDLAIEISKINPTDDTNRIIANSIDNITAIEIIGDSCVALIEQIEYKITEKALFSEVALKEYEDLHSKVAQILSDTVEVMLTSDEELIENVLKKKNTLEALVDTFRINHIERSAKGICNDWAKIRYLEMLTITQSIAFQCIEMLSKIIKR